MNTPMDRRGGQPPADFFQTRRPQPALLAGPRPAPRSWLALAGLIGTLLVNGCGSPPPNPAASEGSSAADLAALIKQATLREAELQAKWKGQPYQALLKQFGEPQLTMNVIGYRPLKTSLVVYGSGDAAAQCVDAFTMVKNDQTGEWTVADYFCR